MVKGLTKPLCFSPNVLEFLSLDPGKMPNRTKRKRNFHLWRHGPSINHQRDNQSTCSTVKRLIHIPRKDTDFPQWGTMCSGKSSSNYYLRQYFTLYSKAIFNYGVLLVAGCINCWIFKSQRRISDPPVSPQCHVATNNWKRVSVPVHQRAWYLYKSESL